MNADNKRVDYVFKNLKKTREKTKYLSNSDFNQSPSFHLDEDGLAQQAKETLAQESEDAYQSLMVQQNNQFCFSSRDHADMREKSENKSIFCPEGFQKQKNCKIHPDLYSGTSQPTLDKFYGTQNQQKTKVNRTNKRRMNTKSLISLGQFKNRQKSNHFAIPKINSEFVLGNFRVSPTQNSIHTLAEQSNLSKIQKHKNKILDICSKITYSKPSTPQNYQLQHLSKQNSKKAKRKINPLSIQCGINSISNFRKLCNSIHSSNIHEERSARSTFGSRGPTLKPQTIKQMVQRFITGEVKKHYSPINTHYFTNSSNIKNKSNCQEMQQILMIKKHEQSIIKSESKDEHI